MVQRILRLLEKGLKLRKGDSCMLELRGCVSILGQCTHIAAEADSQRPEHDDDEHADGDNGAENVVAAAEAEAERTSAAAGAGAGNGRPTAARTSQRSREGRDRRLSNAAYYYWNYLR